MFDSSGLKKFWLLSGYGIADYKLESFDKALINAGVGDYNLIKLSSILPASSVNYSDQPLPWSKGSLIPVAYASNTFQLDFYRASGKTSEYAMISVAIPEDKTLNGLIMESSNESCHQMAINGMKNRNRDVSLILDQGVRCDVKIILDEYEGSHGSSRWEASEDKSTIEFYKYENSKCSLKDSINFTRKMNDKYVTLFSCCVLG